MIRKKIINILNIVVSGEAKVIVSTPESDVFGHYSTNVSFELGKNWKMSPVEAATKLKDKIIEIDKEKLFSKIDVINPGFINFWISEGALQSELKEILKQKNNYGKPKIKSKGKIQIEYVSANPTGPLTAVAGRGGFFGDALSNVLEFTGVEIEREYYVNDTGNQIITLGKSILAVTGDIPHEEKFYKGEYVKDLANIFKEKIIKHKNDPRAIGQLAAKYLLKTIKKSLKDASIHFNRFTSEEKDIIQKGYVEEVLKKFKEEDLTFEKDGAIWLKTTNGGDDKDRVLVTSEGLPTYFLIDAGHYLETFKRLKGYEKINILGPDHHGYKKRIDFVAKKLGFRDSETLIHLMKSVKESNNEESIKVVGQNMYKSVSGTIAVHGTATINTQAFRFKNEGKDEKMSKRKGVFITLSDLLKNIKPDVVRFFFLMQSIDSHMDFDLELAKERSVKNPVYYVQYAYVRCGAILQKSKKQKLNTSSAKKATSILNSEASSKLLRELIRFKEVIEDTSNDYQVHRLTRYVSELSRVFHNFYEKERILGEKNKNFVMVRLRLVLATQIVLGNALSILGIAKPKKM